MIQNRSNSVSAYYSDYVIPSWDKFGYYVNMFDCVYPDTLHEYNYLEFDKYWGVRDFTDGEKAGWYSHTLLWIKCAMENKNIAIIEHDVECIAPLDFTEEGLNFFCCYQNKDEWKNYAERFIGHPYWGKQYKIVPVTHAYTLTPKIAIELLNKIINRPLNNFTDDFLLQHKGLDNTIKNLYNYTKPIYHKNIGGSMEHGK